MEMAKEKPCCFIRCGLKCWLLLFLSMVHIFENREIMVSSLIPANCRIAEIGVFRGDFSKYLYSLNPKKLVLIDVFKGIQCSGDQDGNNVQWTNLEEEYIKLKNWSIHQNNVLIEKGDSSTILSQYPNEFFDAIYLDGDHSYEGVKKT